MSLLYLGGPIDLVNKEERVAWRDEMKKYTEQGVSFFDPAAAFSINLWDKDATTRLVKINADALALCTAAIFVMGPDKASIGTPIEFCMVASGQINVPYLVIWDPKDRPTCPSYNGEVRGPLPAYITGIGNAEVVHSFAEAIDWMNKELGLEINHIYPTPEPSPEYPKMTMNPVPCTKEFIKELAKVSYPEHVAEEDTESL